MADTFAVAPEPSSGGNPNSSGNRTPQIIIRNEAPKQPWFGRTLLKVFLAISIFANFSLFGLYKQYYPGVTANEKYKSGEKFAEEKVAVIKVTGMIMRETVQSAIEELQVATEDDAIKAVVLAVDTPGGTISGSDELYQAIVKFKKDTGKPVVVSMQGMATSGGYYVSVPADKIYAERSCMTGSVGVILSSFTVEKLLQEWGVSSEVIKSGKMKDAGSMFRPLTEDERAYWQSMIDKMFDQFVGVVTTHRGEKLTSEKIRELEGRVILAADAKEMGLVDEIGYEQDAIEAAKSLAGLGDKVRVVTFDRPLGGLIDLLSGQASAPVPLEWQRLAQLGLSQPLLMPEYMLGRLRIE